MLKKKEYKFWFCTGSQDLYGDDVLKHVAEQMGDWAEAMGIEVVYINEKTTIPEFKRDLKLGEVFYR